LTKTDSGAVAETRGSWWSLEAGNSLRSPVFWLLVVGLVTADLWSKAWAHGTLAFEGEWQPVLGEWLSIQKVYNSGGLFGLGQGLTNLFVVVRFLALGFMFWLVPRQIRGRSMPVFTLAILIAGAVGNLYDNLSKWAPWPGNGLVRDFVRVDLGAAPGFLPDWAWPFDPWPIFNLADSCITLGFVLLLTGIARVRLHAGVETGAPAAAAAAAGAEAGDDAPQA